MLAVDLREPLVTIGHAFRLRREHTLLAADVVIEFERKLGELQTRHHVIAAAQRAFESNKFMIEVFVIVMHAPGSARAVRVSEA